MPFMQVKFFVLFPLYTLLAVLKILNGAFYCIDSFTLLISATTVVEF